MKPDNLTLTAFTVFPLTAEVRHSRLGTKQVIFITKRGRCIVFYNHESQGERSELTEPTIGHSQAKKPLLGSVEKTLGKTPGSEINHFWPFGFIVEECLHNME